MHTTVLMIQVLVVVTGIASAIRSTWSPCGVSMLSALSPLSERSRGHRWSVTAALYILGATLGGAALGLLIAPMAFVTRLFSLNSSDICAAIVLLAVLAVMTDLRLGIRLPGNTRQVDEVWITRYRQYVYTMGFAVQIGFGFATVIMTGALYLFAGLMVLNAHGVQAVLLGAMFGFVRGSAILAGFRLTTPTRLRSFHRRFDQLANWSVGMVVTVELAAILAACLVAGWVWLGIALVVVLLGVHLMRLWRRPDVVDLREPIAAAAHAQRQAERVA